VQAVQSSGALQSTMHIVVWSMHLKGIITKIYLPFSKLYCRASRSCHFGSYDQDINCSKYSCKKV